MSGKKSSVKKAAVPERKRTRKDVEKEEEEESYAAAQLKLMAEDEEGDDKSLELQKRESGRPWPFLQYINVSFERAVQTFQNKLQQACKDHDWQGGRRPKLPWTPHEDAILVRVLFKMQKSSLAGTKMRYFVSTC